MHSAGEFFPGERPALRVSRWALTCLMCASFSLNYVAVRSLYPLSLYSAGKADVPFRIFPILVMHAVEKISIPGRVLARLPTELQSADKITVILLAFFGLLLAVWCTSRTSRALGVRPEIANWASLFVVVMSFFNFTPAWGLNYTVPYDVPAMAFFACGVWLIVTGRMVWLYPLFLIATLNRETSCFLVVFYMVWKAIHHRGMPHLARTIGLHVVALTALWLAVKILPAHLYQGHAFSVSRSSLLLSQFTFNLRELIKPQQWPVLASICAFTLPLLWLGRRWIRNTAFAYATAATLGCWFFGSLLEGSIIEIRIFGEWAAVVGPCLVLMISGALEDRSLAATPAPVPVD